MAVSAELKSLEEINYKSKIKVYIYPFIIFFIFLFSFLNYYPLAPQIKSILKKNLKGTGCLPDFDEIRLELFAPKVIISDFKLPSSCLGQSGGNLKFGYISIHFNLINFSPFGLPFKINTEINGQPLSLYFVQGFGKKLIRIKDQTIVLSRLNSITGGKMKLAGNLKLDLNTTLSNSNQLIDFLLKAESKDLLIPPQNIEGFTTPNLKVKQLYIEANALNSSKINIKKIILGDSESAMRANLKGTIQIQKQNFSNSPLNIIGEIAFTPGFKETVPLVDLLFQNFPQKDGFYQIKIGGILGQPQLINP